MGSFTEWSRWVRDGLIWLGEAGPCATMEEVRGAGPKLEALTTVIEQWHKDALYARLRLTEPGPGAVHFPRRMDADYFRQLTAERVVTRYDRGRPIRSWQPKRDGERNEALDTFVYATAALHGLVAMGLRLNDEAAAIAVLPTRGAPVMSGTVPAARPALAPIRSRWMG